ncbi:anhydro-N-acetylmuramic acid kinase [Stenotrophobium rhamnosiphilum]|uniref:Anhydro-N-acetylmuramic acid kinase n=1 Tax=Stenotrophobium rhamnosiphilum TaxID=2029166 RepID=A0A2T5MBD8_9GAMM|nr:anhydro-N-acetylmuramic acid kinase [Stenotrophobium rhamnosiphilum]PTU29038.1 anhydro-N-acetylmuramic acid kinase [Stenotrophobium rhamnosiphilum]
MRALYIGVMSGTSMDGVDAALCEFDGLIFRKLVATHTLQYEVALRERLLHLQRREPSLTLREFVELDQGVAKTFASAVQELIAQAGVQPSQITAIGSHGQTIFHDPLVLGSSLQLGNPSLISAHTDIDTVADFRRKDMALGGHGAPLVPAFHEAIFGSRNEMRCAVNIGGIANITVLPCDEKPVRGFDTGPGNGLMDEWAARHLQKSFDHNGEFAAAGTLNQNLLDALLADPYFALTPPKSTGRGDFHLDWLEQRYPTLTQLSPADVQRTLCELTARSIVDAIAAHAPTTHRIIVCGGGSKNGFLMQRLTALSGKPVGVSDDYGLSSSWVEAAAFAWLAMRTINNLPGNLPAVTGASASSILGGIFRA